TGDEVCRFTGLGEKVRSVAPAPQGRRVLVTTGDTLREFDMDSRKEVGNARRGGILSSNGQLSFAIETSEGQMQARFRSTDGSERNAFPLLQPISEPCVGYAAQDDSAVFAGKDGTLFACTFKLRRAKRIQAGVDGFLAVACSTDGDLALLGTQQGSLHLVDLNSDSVLCNDRDAARRAVRTVAFTP